LADLWVSANPDRAHLLSHVLRNLLCTPLGLCLRKTGNDLVVNRQTQVRGESGLVQTNEPSTSHVSGSRLHHVVQSRVSTVRVDRKSTTRRGRDVALTNRLHLKLAAVLGNTGVGVVEPLDHLLGGLHVNPGLGSHGLGSAAVNTAEVHDLGVLPLLVVLLTVLTESRASGQQVKVRTVLERLN